MGTPWPENQCAHRKGKIEKLIKDQARYTAAQLQILSEKPTGDHDGLEKLLEKRFTSFTESLSHVSLCRCEDCECEVTQIPNRVGSPITDQISVDSGKGKRPAAEDRGGSYERKFRGSNERSFPSKTFCKSGSHSGRISSESISTQNTTSSSSSAASERKESWGIVESNDSFKDVPNGRSCRFQGSFQIENRQISFSKFWNLTRITGEIGLLKSLTRLDISKCYYLDHLPKEISNLLQLEVLKGFVVGNSMEKDEDSCTLEHLEDFPVISEPRDLNRLKKHHKLRIDWGGVSVHKSENITKVDNSSEESPAVESTKQENHGHADTEVAVYVGNKRESNNNPTNAAESGAKCNFLSTVELSEKFVALSLLSVENDASPELNLKCLLRKSAPDWPRASKQNKIKKLHIEGGPLSYLGRLALQEKSEWQVEKLRRN